jgi:CheY-like chemotaxis protein
MHEGEEADMGEHLRRAPIALVVEDDPDLRELAAALLEETELRVVECADAEQAFGVLCDKGDDVALIFADVRLPGLLDGAELAQRAHTLWPHARIVVTSGYPKDATLPDDIVYMQKPWLALDVLMQAERAADHMRAARAA